MRKNPEIGERLKEFASANYDSLSEFCKEMGISLQAIYPYLRGESLPGTKFLVQLQKLGCSIDWLLSGKKSDAELMLEKLKKIIEGKSQE